MSHYSQCHGMYRVHCQPTIVRGASGTGGDICTRHLLSSEWCARHAPAIGILPAFYECDSVTRGGAWLRGKEFRPARGRESMQHVI
jgi:hypothetical protein